MTQVPDIDAATKAARVREYERQTTCSDEWIRHPFGPLIYTSGIKFVAETCEAYWLIDLVASHQSAVRAVLERRGLRPFQVWRLHQVKSTRGEAIWVIDAWSDTPEAPDSDEGPASVLLARQSIGFSTFPESLSPFEFWVEGETALLKAEH